MGFDLLNPSHKIVPNTRAIEASHLSVAKPLAQSQKTVGQESS